MQIAVASAVLRNDVFRLVVGQLILTAGLGALVLYWLRSRTTDRPTLYFGLIATLYGLRLTIEVNALQSAFPSFPWDIIHSSITLVIGFPFAFFLGSTLARAYLWFIRSVVFANTLLAIAGAVRLVERAPMDPIWFSTGVLTVVSLLGWIFIGFFPRIPIDREVRILKLGLLVLALFALTQNLAVMGVLPSVGFYEPLGMVFLLGTFFYVSASRSFRQEASLIAIHSELGMARQIQSALLPNLDKAIAGFVVHARYSPMGSVAGDFYDVLSDKNGLGVLIADVSGHGVPAALSASMLKVALRAQADSCAHPSEVLAGLNRALTGMLGSQFITAAYVYFNFVHRKLTYAGAGHPPILLWHSSSRSAEFLEENGFFLGPFPDARYSERHTCFEPGDRCLLYTDGVVEASNGQLEEFGNSRLRQFLATNATQPTTSFCSALLHAVTDWSQADASEQQDDITFAAVEYCQAQLPADATPSAEFIAQSGVHILV